MNTPDVNPLPWDAFTAEFLSLYQPPMRSAATRARMRHVCSLLSSLGVTSTDQLNAATVARFIAARPPGESPVTTHSMVGSLRAVCNYAASSGYCRVSPFALRKHWVRRGRPTREKQHHSREEIARVLSLARAEVDRKRGWAQWRARRLYVLASLLAYTGLRRKEALWLRIEDVDLEHRMLLIRPRAGRRLKTEASAQPVPIPDALVPVLAEWLPHLALPDGPVPENAPMPAWNPEGVRDPGWLVPNAYRTGPWEGGSNGSKPLDKLKALGRRAGVEGLTFLSLRHSWATHAELWGLSDAMIQRVLRHTNTQTQWHYRHADHANIREKVRGVGFGHELAGAETAAASAPSAAVKPAPAAPPPERTPPGSVSHGPKLSPDDAREMRELREAGWPYKALLARYRVSKSTLHCCLYGVTHKEAGGPIARPLE